MWRILRAWWIWAAIAIYLLATDHWIAAPITAFVGIFLYHATPVFHPLIYALDQPVGTDTDDFWATLAGLTGALVIGGNRLAVLNDGDEFFPAMLSDLENAQASITMEQYILWEGEIGKQFAEVLADKAKLGVPVKILLDAVGSATIGEAILSILEKGGCQVAWFHPIHWYTLNRANFRTHRKSVIVDGRIAYTGGAGIADHWRGKARNEHEWRDTQVRVEGPAAVPHQTAFAENWLQTTGEMISGPLFFPTPERAGNVEIQTIQSTPRSGNSAAGTMYFFALQCAREYVYIANPYFIPSLGLTAIFKKLSRKGVDIKVMVAGPLCDTWWARQNTIRLQGRLLEAGVEVYEYEPAMLHQKTMLVDGSWGTVGTTNFDNRSFALNEETNVCFHDRATLRKMRETFFADLAKCKQVKLTEWRRRGLFQRSQEIVASIVEDQV